MNCPLKWTSGGIRNGKWRARQRHKSRVSHSVKQTGYMSRTKSLQNRNELGQLSLDRSYVTLKGTETRLRTIDEYVHHSQIIPEGGRLCLKMPLHEMRCKRCDQSAERGPEAGVRDRDGESCQMCQ